MATDTSEEEEEEAAEGRWARMDKGGVHNQWESRGNDTRNQQEPRLPRMHNRIPTEMQTLQPGQGTMAMTIGMVTAWMAVLLTLHRNGLRYSRRPVEEEKIKTTSKDS